MSHGVVKIYRPDAGGGNEFREFSWRAAVTGVLLGALFSASNVYVGLKLGSALGVSLASALLGYGLWSSLRGVSRGRIGRWGILENNISQTASSAAGTAASAGLVSAIPALALLTGQQLAWHWLALWIFSVMLVGIVVAIPMRRQMIVREKLPFPVGIASSEMLRELHARGGEAIARVKMMLSAGLVAAVGKIVLTVCSHYHLPVTYALPLAIREIPAKALTIIPYPSLLPIGIGGLIGIRTGCALLLGALLAYGAIAPVLIGEGHVEPVGQAWLEKLPATVELSNALTPGVRYDGKRELLISTGLMTKQRLDDLARLSDDSAYLLAVHDLYQSPQFGILNKWLLWPGVTLIVAASLVSLGMSWWSAFKGRGGDQIQNSGLRKRDSDAFVPPPTDAMGHPADSDSRLEVGICWGWYGPALIGVSGLSVALQVGLFGIAWWAAVVAVVLAFGLATVAARVAGETGIGTTGPMGKVAQLAFGAIVPRNPVPNLMAANVAGGAASQCGDLLDDLKCGHLLGASPGFQTWAQLCGAAVGAMAGAAAYVILIPEPGQMLGTEEWAAPAAQSWKAVAEVFAKGWTKLPAGTGAAIRIAATVGVVLAVLRQVLPEKWRFLAVSPVGMGLAFVLPAYFSFSIFVGGLAAWMLGRWCKSWASRFLVATCAGVIAGESLTGIGTAIVKLIIQ